MDITLPETSNAGGAASRLPGKPRIAIMGEFSAGKSTLSNMLIGREALPTKVTATQLPPVWISQGDDHPFSRSLEGEELPFSFDQLDHISPYTTEYIRIFHQSETLELFDLIDMPGISDPNIPSEVWERVLQHADAVIWCTHATQAWRQSEAAVWETYSETLAEKSIMLVTRFDKILGETDRRRVLQRLQTEAGDDFRAILPISLTEALAAETAPELWEQSGAEAFASALIELSQELAGGNGPPQRPTAPMPAASDPTVVPLQPVAVAQSAAMPGVVPRRVQSTPSKATRTVRPPRQDGPIFPDLPTA